MRDDPLDLYTFDENPQVAADFEVANWYTATHPDSIFMRTLTCQRSTHVERLILRNYDFSIDRGGQPEKYRLANEDQIWSVLSERFGIARPADAKLPELRPMPL